VIFDGRNLWEPERMRRLGFEYHSVGRPPVLPTCPTSVARRGQDRSFGNLGKNPALHFGSSGRKRATSTSA
jgi:hypothetical protein